jgi:hypothetical protein
MARSGRAGPRPRSAPREVPGRRAAATRPACPRLARPRAHARRSHPGHRRRPARPPPSVRPNALDTATTSLRASAARRSRAACRRSMPRIGVPGTCDVGGRPDLGAACSRCIGRALLEPLPATRPPGRARGSAQRMCGVSGHTLPGPVRPAEPHGGPGSLSPLSIPPSREQDSDSTARRPRAPDLTASRAPRGTGRRAALSRRRRGEARRMSPARAAWPTRRGPAWVDEGRPALRPSAEPPAGRRRFRRAR